MSDFNPLFRQAKERKLDPERKSAIRKKFTAHMESSVRNAGADCLQEGMDPSPLFATAAKTKLPADRKDAFRDEFRAHMMKPRPEPRASAWSKAYGFLMGGHWKASVACLALVSTLGNVSYAAEASVPGDALYTVKTQLNEPVMGLFAFTPAARARLELRIVARRLREAEILDSQNRLTPDALTALSGAIERHSDVIDAKLRQLKELGRPIRGVESAAQLSQLLKERPDALAKLAIHRPGLLRFLRTQILQDASAQPPASGPLRGVIRYLRNH